jgi:hypothetical protein
VQELREVIHELRDLVAVRIDLARTYTSLASDPPPRLSQLDYGALAARAEEAVSRLRQRAGAGILTGWKTAVEAELEAMAAGACGTL